MRASPAKVTPDMPVSPSPPHRSRRNVYMEHPARRKEQMCMCKCTSVRSGVITPRSALYVPTPDTSAREAEGSGPRQLDFKKGGAGVSVRPSEHFQEKWIPVFRQKMRPLKKRK